MTPTIPIMTLSEAAAYLKVSRRTVERMIARRQLRPVRVGRCVRVRLSELERAVGRLEG